MRNPTLYTFAIYNGSKFDRYVRAASRDEALDYAFDVHGRWGDAESLNMRNRFGEDRYGHTVHTAPSVGEVGRLHTA